MMRSDESIDGGRFCSAHAAWLLAGTLLLPLDAHASDPTPLYHMMMIALGIFTAIACVLAWRLTAALRPGWLRWFLRLLPIVVPWCPVPLGEDLDLPFAVLVLFAVVEFDPDDVRMYVSALLRVVLAVAALLVTCYSLSAFASDADGPPEAGKGEAAHDRSDESGSD